MNTNANTAGQRWQPADRSKLAPESISGPSLTYWQDCWQRLKRNKSALISMVIIIVVVLSAIFVPIFWPYSYEEQNLMYANIPPDLDIYDLGEGHYIYITNEFKCIDTDDAGHLLGASNLVFDDKTNRSYEYEINGKPLVVDYGVYFRAKTAYTRLAAQYRDEGTLPVAEAEYLQAYFGDTPPCVRHGPPGRGRAHPGKGDRTLPCLLRRAADPPF